ncbi:MAG: CDP-alcohol phosphatidyltransferase family protein [Bacteroidia bacterium]|nr:CDP-alcohol phosphatidyltransferase family protein [Bacteroidia bacterium]
MKAQIPNALTLGNLACGFTAIILVLLNKPEDIGWLVAGLMAVAMIFDFFDGFLARALKVASPLGLQLDSLADMVTFGVLPGVMAFTILNNNTGSPLHLVENAAEAANFVPGIANPWALWAIMIPVLSGYRLGKFNIDTRQGGVFYGLATPANAFFFLSLFLIFAYDSPFNRGKSLWDLTPSLLSWLTHPMVLIPLVTLFSLLLVSEFKLIAFKFKGYGFKANWAKYTFAATSLILLIIFFYKAVPLIILLYFAFSIVDNYILKK